jgi:hypothetical protein
VTQRRRQPRPARAVIRPEMRALAAELADAFWGGRETEAPVVEPEPTVEPVETRPAGPPRPTLGEVVARVRAGG